MLGNLTKALSVACLLFASSVNATYIYEANQSLFDLTNQTGTTNMAVGDDAVSAAFNLDFTFTFYGEDFTSARMATNGCLHFKTTGSYCNDYTPDPLPEITYTLYPFWTDLIRDNGSKVLAKNFTDKTVFGWYDLREYNRSNTDNSFEVILWNSNDTFEFRYGALDIINHDVLIGEQGTSSELYTYYYHDQCGKGTTNSSSCVSQTWNASTMNTTLENGGSLYGLGSGNALDCSNPLNNSACVGYDAAYLVQQCGLDSLHSTSCPLYWEAYDDLQCDLDPQYAPFCAGYTQEASVAYYIEDEFDYGYEEETNYGYHEEEFYYDDLIEEELYEEYVTFFEEDQYEELFFEVPEEFEVFVFEEEQYEEILTVIEEEYYIPLETMELDELPLILEEEYIDFVADVFEQETPDIIFLEETLMFEEFERREIIIEEEYMEEEPVEYLEFETIEELEEWFEEEEEIAEELEEEVEEIEEEVEETRVAEEEKGGITSQMLNVVANTIQTATNSVSGTTSGTSIHATGNTKASGGSVAGNTTATAVTSSVTGGQSMSNSPSISAQVVSSVVQTQQVLNSFSTDSSVANTVGTQNTAVGNTDSGSNVAVGSTATTNTETTTNTSVASNTSGNNNTAVGNTGGDENAAVGETTGPQNTAVVFENNMQDQQEQLEQQQEETGEYADSTQLVAYMGTVPGFDAYRQVALPQASTWYEPKDIYMSALMPDNNQAFFGMYSDSLNGLKALQDLQPNL